MSRCLWKPDREFIQETAIYRFQHHVAKNEGISFDGYEDFHQWSVNAPEKFWNAVWDFCGMKSVSKGAAVIENAEDIEKAKFFPQAQLNFAENLLQRRDKQDAIVFWGEDQLKRKLSFAALYAQVSRVAQAMRAYGLNPGDRVVAMMPNMPETVIFMLAAASMGCIWASCSPDFGVDGVLDRFGQIEPVLFITSDSYIYRKQHINYFEKAKEIVGRLPSVQQTIVVPYFDHCEANLAENMKLYKDFIAPYEEKEIQFTALPFDHPLYIMFSSGTTGVPKCIVHGAGGTLLQHLKEHQLHADIRPGDRVFYYSTCGWMMWNWQVSALASGATLLLYDGSPFHPKRDILFDFAAQENMTFMGVGSKYIDALKKFRVEPKVTHDLSHLRMVASTGGPLVAESFEYIYEKVSDQVCLASISGGTDIVSCFVLGNPTLPVYAGEIQCKGLGMAVAVFDEAGQALQQQKGELVCTKPFPSRPIYFWRDADHQKRHQTYFNTFPNVWAHGDFAEMTVHGGVVIYGRSDAVLNPGGVRIGTAEIYRQVERVDEVIESLAIGQEWRGDVRVILFVTLKDHLKLNAELNARIKKAIRDNATPRHVPTKIIQVQELPKTKSGKLVELAVRDIIHNRPIKNKTALANPECLQAFKDIPELQCA